MAMAGARNRAQDLFKALEKEFGERVFFTYQSFEGGDLGPLVKVENDDAFEEMKDYLDDDVQSDDPVHSGTLEIEVYPAPAPAKGAAQQPGAVPRRHLPVCQWGRVLAHLTGVGPYSYTPPTPSSLSVCVYFSLACP